MDPFRTLGLMIDQIWKEQGYNPEVLPAIAARQLRESGVLHQVELRDIAEWLVCTDKPVPQSLREFGQPPITLYSSEHFYIEALVWLDSTTAIHQHSFTGAFGVLSGSSVQTEYRFHKHAHISQDVALGELQFVSSELLQRGDVREIIPGDSLIHALFHLEHPSISIVVRTKSIKTFEPQYEYIKPSLCVAISKPEPFTTQFHLLFGLKQVDLPLFWETTRQMVERCKDWMLLPILSLAYSRATETAEWQELTAAAVASHGKWVEKLLPCVAEYARDNELIARRKKVLDPVHRFFLALLLNVPNRAHIDQLIAERFPGSAPEVLILQWLKELSEQKAIGLKFNAISLRMLEHSMHGLSLEQARNALEQEFELQSSPETQGRLLSLWNEIQTAAALRPLLRPESSVESGRSGPPFPVQRGVGRLVEAAI
jgi:hypothetical protein